MISWILGSRLRYPVAMSGSVCQRAPGDILKTDRSVTALPMSPKSVGALLSGRRGKSKTHKPRVRLSNHERARPTGV